MEPIFIGITGGSGAGKSTACTTLAERYPDKIGVLQLDDYLKLLIDMPKFKGFFNRDHPDALDLNMFEYDLLELKAGNSIIVDTKNEKLNPIFKKTKKKVLADIYPKPIMLIDGHLILFDGKIRKLLTMSIWLDVPQETRWQRRLYFKTLEYGKWVHMPMYKKYVEPTKRYATHVVDAFGFSKTETVEAIENKISPFLR